MMMVFTAMITCRCGAAMDASRHVMIYNDIHMQQQSRTSLPAAVKVSRKG
jgi:hypothetical protein